MDRVNAQQCVISNEFDIPVRVFANEEVGIETAAIQELNQLLQLESTVHRMAATEPDLFETTDFGVKEVAITPDFHKGAGIPIGTVLLTKGFVAPQAIGRDVNCGMRLLVTDLSEEQVRSALPVLEKRIRHVFFQGGREIPIHRKQKAALLTHGLAGLHETSKLTGDQGIWKYYRPEEQLRDLAHVIDGGSYHTDGIFEGLANYADQAEISYDSQIGSIGGGNHFVEVQRVKDVRDAATAYAWGLKKDAVVIMIHTGSVSVGYPTSGYMQDLIRSVYPRSLKYPQNGIFPLPVSGRFESEWATFRRALHNAANFAFGNRLFLGLMMRKVLEETFGSMQLDLLYDSGHNLVWEEEIGGEQCFLHRKGACPARGAEQMQETPFYWTGEPALIPGSMGASSFIMAGGGSRDSLFSASHGAGRSLSRGKSGRVDDRKFQAFMDRFKIITPIDPMDITVRNRRDILDKWKTGIKQEAPWAFKDIGPVIDTQVAAGMVRSVVETEPIFTVKG